MENAKSRVRKILEEYSGNRRSSPRFAHKSREPEEEKLTTGVEDNFVKRRRKFIDVRKEAKPIPLSANNVINGLIGSNGHLDPVVTKADAHYLVVKTLRTFNKLYLHFVQEEEHRVHGISLKASNFKGQQKNSNKPNSSEKSKVDQKANLIIKRGSKRPDLKAISKMIVDGDVLYPTKVIGHLPGIDVGHHFFSRAEMVAVGLHSHWLNGIDYMGFSYGKMAEYKKLSFPLAICIVLSGMYEDDLDNSEDIIYTGQGGQDLLGNKRQVKDQKMERGNLALKVRKYWAEKGVSGFTVFKYQLRRLAGQPALTSSQVQFMKARRRLSISALPGFICEDISGGQENLPIPVTNMVDDACFPPEGYSYIKNMQLAEGLSLPPNVAGCQCQGDCINPRACACARLNGSDFPYVRRNGGRLIEAKDVVFECGPNCGCLPSCPNRVSQQGMKYRLEVFRTTNKGWGVRSWDTIPSGAPVCQYVGVLKRTEDVDDVSENNFIFEIDCLQTINGLDGREKRPGDVSFVQDMIEKKLENPEYCIDAGSMGNVARFINHSCEPNLFVQCILNCHHDIHLATIMLFAADTIPPLQELTYDYGYALNSVVGSDGEIKQMTCSCGAGNCRGRLF
ncbi:histone-lysine N-methyltransferase, H3 lysine-9 specific SUVH4-like protein isoform X2 [Wolffia australiana]